MKKLFSTDIIALLVMSMMILIGLGCNKVNIVEQTTDDVNITGYLDKNPEQFSEFRKILELSGTSGFLQAYGAYTMFLPDNDAVEAYLSEKGVSSVEQISKEDLFDIVTFHVIPDSIKTTDFTDGKLRNATMYGQYLVTGAVFDEATEVSTIQIDRQAKLTQGNIRVGNGVIHVIDRVMKPATLSVAQTLEADPKYSIFSAAIKLTGFYDRLNQNPKTNPDQNERHLTVFAETDEALKSAGFNSIDDLTARYSKGNPTDAADSLNIYVGYHIVKDAQYFVDIVNPVKLTTLAVKSISTTNKSKTEVAINEFIINGVVEAGSPLLRSEGDVSARNGVIHAVRRHFRIIDRPAQALYWEVTDQPEFRRLTQWRSSNYTYNLQGATPQRPMANLKWNNNRHVIYKGGLSKGFNGDVLGTPLASSIAGGSNKTNRANYIEYYTPYMAPGRYKFWICYPRVSSSGNMAFWFNGVQLSRIVDVKLSSGTNSWTDEEREQAGWKRYMGPSTVNIDDGMGRLLGVVTVTEGGTQLIRQEVLYGSYAENYELDMIHLIPEKDEQIWPRFWVNGRVQQKGEPD